MLSPCTRQVTHALLTRPPLSYKSLGFIITPFDLHVLSTPPAFILSQDQTLELKVCSWLRINIWLILFRFYLCLGFVPKIHVRIFGVGIYCFVIKVQLCGFYETERRRRDLNPCAAVNDLLPFQGSPFGQLGYFSMLDDYNLYMNGKIERREWDSNPRPLTGSLVFKT